MFCVFAASDHVADSVDVWRVSEIDNPDALNRSRKFTTTQTVAIAPNRLQIEIWVDLAQLQQFVLL